MNETNTGRVFGSIPGTKPGDRFVNRAALNAAGVHRPTQAGISGSANEGADSIVVSGGYIDDRDYGNVIIYTGHGGNDPKTKRQIEDQKFERGNKALGVSCDLGLPIRVVRGADSHNPFAPASGYQYYGLFVVSRYWQAVGEDGFKIWRFRLEQTHSPGDELELKQEALPMGIDSPTVVSTAMQRMVRSTQVSVAVKKLYNFRCQICDTRLETLSGGYAEACHIRPLGAGHCGPDKPGNVLCLCPNCHVRFDGYSLWISDDLVVYDHACERVSDLTIDPSHAVSTEELNYHRGLCDRS